MRNIVYLVAIVLIALWAAGFFFYQVGNLIHLLLIIAIISILFNIIKGSNNSRNSIN